MLIKALCDYYDMMFDKGFLAPKGYDNVEVTHTIYLKKDGAISSIRDCRTPKEITNKKGKSKITYIPKLTVFPKRNSKSAIGSEFVEHRAKYIFGLDYKNGKFCTTKKEFETFKKENLEFIEGINSPIVNAYRNFILNWDPVNETNNEHLVGIQNSFDKAKFEFKLAGDEQEILHKDVQLDKRWQKKYYKDLGNNEYSQCCIYGENEKIAKTHDAIRKLHGGESSGCCLICFNNDADCSYGKKQSYNSNVSIKAMEKYAKSLNYIIRKNNIVIDDINQKKKIT